ncbi:KilA-N domain-containing protein [Adhaeribacter aquaticus]|uniref:KilA-N domain-containing protein n=1 Tax=Adhaeribacter aquaticus TaxID=299567 RepID=UPI00040F61DE|nr:KilA-N domain-containing protein [Adhaeribacter aquaticus]
MKAVIPFSFAGVEISKDGEGRISLTDLWKASGNDRFSNPNAWLRQDATQTLIDTAAGILNTSSERIIKSKKGKGGGTFAHKQIALAYAKYLSPELHLTVNQVFLERIEEEKNPDLIIDRGIRTYKKHGKSDNWIAERLNGKVARLAFCASLAAHGVKGIGFRDCTNAILTPMYGGGAQLVREKKNLPVKANTREHMTETELAAIRFTELLAADNIEKKGLQGNKECEYECYNTARLVAKTIIQSRNAA